MKNRAATLTISENMKATISNDQKEEGAVGSNHAKRNTTPTYLPSHTGTIVDRHGSWWSKLISRMKQENVVRFSK
jgi:hypothetical protein